MTLKRSLSRALSWGRVWANRIISVSLTRELSKDLLEIIIIFFTWEIPSWNYEDKGGWGGLHSCFRHFQEELDFFQLIYSIFNCKRMITHKSECAIFRDIFAIEGQPKLGKLIHHPPQSRLAFKKIIKMKFLGEKIFTKSF